MKFKITKSTHKNLILEGNYISNGVYLVDINWINSIKHRTFTAFKARIKKEQLKLVSERVTGEVTRKKFDLEGHIQDASKLIPLELVDKNKAQFFKGLTSESTGLEVKAAYFQGTYIDIDYAALCFLDPNVELYASASANTFIIKKDGVTVGMIAPMNRDKIESYIKELKKAVSDFFEDTKIMTNILKGLSNVKK